MTSTRPIFAVGAAAVAMFGLTSCAESEADAANEPAAQQVETSVVSGIRVVTPEEAAETIADAPDDLVILDVRTQDEFDEAHIDGAVLLDFYRDDFADRLAELDPTVPYVLYCRSGNRSGQARAIMDDLGFQSVEDVDGGIVGWQQAGLPTVAG